MDSAAYVIRTYSRLAELTTRHSQVSTHPGYAVVTHRMTDISPYRTIGTASSKPRLEATDLLIHITQWEDTYLLTLA
jgi:hypothetical protein